MDFRVRTLLMSLLISVIAVTLVVCAPLMTSYGTFTGLGGVAGFIEGGWEGHGLASAIYAIGDVCCHQLESRSFFINGSQMPICMRDFGFIIGLIPGFIICIILRNRLSNRFTAYIGAFLIALMAMEWLIETTGADFPTARFISGIIAGIGATLVGRWLLYRES